MVRKALLGSVTMGLSAAVAGYIWVNFEFPFAIVLPAVLGILAVSLQSYPARRALLAAAVGGVGFTVALMVAFFFALTDGSPFALQPWAGALSAAAVSGALTGAILQGRRGSATLAVFSAAGMLAGVLVAVVMRNVAPAGIDVPGAAQSLFFAATIGLVGFAVGGFIGAGVERMRHETAPHELDASGPGLVT